MALSKLFVAGRSIMNAEHIAMTAFKKIFGFECGWMHRTVSNNNWMESGAQPFVRLAGCIFYRKDNEEKLFLVDVVVDVQFIRTVKPVEHGHAIGYDVVSIVVKTTPVIKGPRAMQEHSFMLNKIDTLALPAARYELIAA